MMLLRRFRFSMAMVMMMVATSAAASALFAKIRQHVPLSTQAYLKIDAPILFLGSIGLTAVALGALKGHSLGQMMLQIMVACLGYVSLIGLAESGSERPLLYWFQASFGLLVTGPLLARRIVKNEMERGPKRTLWRKRLEAVFFAFLTMMLVLLGLLLQFLAAYAVPGPGEVLMRWVGIDEAGYGPNLGPLVMTAVVLEGPDDPPPDVWGDLPRSIDRAGGASDRLWADDSKQVYRGGKGLDRLDASMLATLAATGRPLPKSLGGLFEGLGGGSLADVELAPWLDGGDPRFPPLGSRTICEWTLALRPFEGASWRVVDVRSEVIGPRRFNDGLEATGSKALVHFKAFARLLTHLRATTPEGQDLAIKGDKHGGRHFYGDLLEAAFPDAQVARGPEGPALSRYELLGPTGQRLTLSLVPRADADDGAVALASIVSKAAREHWMAAFNAYWQARLPGLKPTAGYPVDAARFRLAIEAGCQARGLSLADWWRAK